MGYSLGIDAPAGVHRGKYVLARAVPMCWNHRQVRITNPDITEKNKAERWRMKSRVSSGLVLAFCLSALLAVLFLELL